MFKNEEFENFVQNYFKNHSIVEIESALRFDENKKKRANLLHHIITENVENIVKEFYEFNLNNVNAKKHFRSKSEIEHLMEINRTYFPYLFSGPFDEKYYNEKLKIGYMHYLRSIPSDIYLASIGNLNSILSRLWISKFTDRMELYEAQSITSDVLFVEIYFTLNTYYTFSEMKYLNERDKVNEILDNIQDAYFIINKKLEISNVVSKSCFYIFNTDIAGKKIETICHELNMNKSDVLILSIKQYFENIFSIESVFNMLPNIVEISNNKIIKLSYTSILDKNKNPEKIIVCASDITDHLKEKKNIEEDYQKNLSLIQIIKNRNEFDNLLREIAAKNIILLDCDDSKKGKMILHEYKNSFARFGLTSISTLINNLEFEIIEKEKIDKFSAKEFFSLSCCMISDVLKKFLEDNFDILGIPS